MAILSVLATGRLSRVFLAYVIPINKASFALYIARTCMHVAVPCGDDAMTNLKFRSCTVLSSLSL